MDGVEDGQVSKGDMVPWHYRDKLDGEVEVLY